MSSYVFEENVEARELVRLHMIEAAFDATTIETLQRTGISTGWKCLELGPGAGSIMRWMAEKVGRDGLIVGVDKNTSHLRELSLPDNCQIKEGDIGALNLDVSLKLVHGRYVLIHNQNDSEILASIRGSLKPGGYVVLEEPDFTSAMFLNDLEDTSQRKVNTAMCKMFSDAGLEPAYGLGLPKKLIDAGFDIVEVNTAMHLCGGNSAVALLMAESATVLSHEYTATGEADGEDIKRYVGNAHDTEYWPVYYSTVSVIAKAIGVA